MIRSKKEFNILVGNNIKKYRIEKGYRSQKIFAKVVGVSRSTIAAIESKNINKGISPYVLYKIAKVLDKRLEDFFI